MTKEFQETVERYRLYKYLCGTCVRYFHDKNIELCDYCLTKLALLKVEGVW